MLGRARLEMAEHRHRDYRGGNGGGEGQSDLQAQIHIGCREDERDEDAEHQPAQGNFLDPLTCNRAAHSMLSY